MITAVLLFWILLPPLGGENRLVVLTGFDRPPDTPAVEWMEREVAGLLSNAGLTFSWEEQKRHNELGAANLVVWVQFHGDCRVETGARSSATNGSLASTKVQDGEIQPIIDVDCDRTAAIVWHNRGALVPALATRTFGRALGRMVAHELYHYFTQSVVHSSSDLFSRTLAPGDLTREKVRFETQEIEAVRAGLRERVLRSAQAAPPEFLDGDTFRKNSPAAF